MRALCRHAATHYTNPSLPSGVEFTLDITLYVKRSWYDFIYWFDPGESEMRQKLGSWLGGCGHTFVAGDCFYILDKNCKTRVTNSTMDIPEPVWRELDTVRLIEEFNESGPSGTK